MIQNLKEKCLSGSAEYVEDKPIFNLGSTFLKKLCPKLMHLIKGGISYQKVDKCFSKHAEDICNGLEQVSTALCISAI